VITVLLGISGVIGMVIFQKPDMKTVYGYFGLGILDISLIIVGLFLNRFRLYGSEKDVRDVS